MPIVASAQELTRPIDGYASLVLAKEAMQFPEDSSNLDGPWSDQDLQQGAV